MCTTPPVARSARTTSTPRLSKCAAGRFIRTLGRRRSCPFFSPVLPLRPGRRPRPPGSDDRPDRRPSAGCRGPGRPGSSASRGAHRPPHRRRNSLLARLSMPHRPSRRHAPHVAKYLGRGWAGRFQPVAGLQIWVITWKVRRSLPWLHPATVGRDVEYGIA